MTIKEWLNHATAELHARGINSARLDSELLLAHTVHHPRPWLHAHDDEELDMRETEIATARLDLRKDFVPIAYIIGHKEFYGRRFSVTTDTLIPRPESEQLVELLSAFLPQTAPLPIDATKKRLVDVGTGSGCLGITAKLEYPELDVSLLDISTPALKVAKKNAAALGAEVRCIQSDLLDNYPFSPDIVLANLPYVDKSWKRSKETDHEPAEALFASNNGLRLIETLVSQLSTQMRVGSVAIFEADPRQWPAIDAFAVSAGFSVLDTRHFAQSYRKL